jgi:hypothetical protein
MEEKRVSEAVPLGQRLMDRPFLLLVLGLLIMVVFYTGWGLFEILRLTPSPLP